MKNVQPRQHNQTQPDMVAIGKIVLRKWGVLAGVLGLFLAGGAIALILYTFQQVYDAKQYIRVVQNREFADIDDTNSKTDPKSVLAPIKSDFLLLRLLMDDGVNSRPDVDLEALRKMVRYENVGGELFTIVCRDHDPEYAARVVEVMATEFLDFQRNYRDRSLTSLDESLDAEIKKANAEIVRINDKLTELKTRGAVSGPGVEGPVDSDGTYCAELKKDRLYKRMELSQYYDQKEKLKLALNAVGEGFDQSSLLEVVNAAPSIVAIDRQLQELKQAKSTLPPVGASHPKLSSLNKQIAKAEQSRQVEFNRQLELKKLAWIGEQKASIGERLAEVEETIAASKTRIDSLGEEIGRLENRMLESVKNEFEFNQTLKEQERAYLRLADWNNKKDRIESKGMSLYQVSREGKEGVVPPTEPVEEYPLKMIGLGALVALALPFAAAFALELRLCRISNSEQVKKQLPFKLLGEVADLPTRASRLAKQTSKRMTRQLRLYEESVDNLSAILVFTAADRPLCFSVTSAASNEGKTTLSSQLAISSARSNFGRTLIIDADIRSPSIHRLFEGSLNLGLGDVLSGTVSLDEAISETSIDNLDMLTAGKLRSNPRRYFSDGNWAALLEEAKKRYDHVIIDTPPVLAASESLAISKECDHTLMCVLRDVSRSDSVKRAYERLISADVNVVGYAFGGVPQTEYAIKYGSYEYNLS